MAQWVSCLQSRHAHSPKRECCSTNHQKKKIIANHNLQALNRARNHGLWCGHTPVLEFARVLNGGTQYILWRPSTVHYLLAGLPVGHRYPCHHLFGDRSKCWVFAQFDGNTVCSGPLYGQLQSLAIWPALVDPAAFERPVRICLLIVNHICSDGVARNRLRGLLSRSIGLVW